MSERLSTRDEEYLIKAYLEEFGGDWHHYVRSIARMRGRGQSFFNALSEKDQARTRGTYWDTFHTDSYERIEETIIFLIS